MRFKMIFQVLVAVFLLISESNTTIPGRSYLRKRPLDNSDALCNDFSRAFYYASDINNNNEWIIFFEGGGGCSSFQECNVRWLRYENRSTPNPLMSSQGYDDFVIGKDLLSGKASENPLFYNFTRILVPYCSQDAFLADRSNPNIPDPSNYTVNDRTFNNTDGADNFIYKGRVIFQSVIRKLINNHGLADASTVVLAGSSSGGIGVLNHIQWVEDTLLNESSSMPPEVLAIIDSSWFVKFSGSHVVDWKEDVANLFNFPPVCLDFTLGFSCCTSPACLFKQGHMSGTSAPIFVASSTYDIFTLNETLRETINRVELEDDQELLRIFNSYGSIMNESFIQSYSSYPSLTIFAPSCTQHVFLATSDLWGEGKLLNQTVDSSVKEGPFELTNPIKNGNWDEVKVKPHDQSLNFSSFHQALQMWFANPTLQRFYSDNCSGPVCGNYCTSTINLNPTITRWPHYVEIIVLVLAALMTAIPSFIKSGLYIQMKVILFCQRVYAYRLKHSPKTFPKATVPINVSCVNLYYRIDTVTSGRERKAESYMTPDHEEQNYNLYAAVETFFPCCKKPCLKCISRKNVPVDDQYNSSTTATVQLTRVDSGISSSINSRMRSITPNSLDTESVDSLDIDADGSKSSLVGIGNNSYQEGESKRLKRSASSLKRERRSISKKTILHRVNMYVNSGELVAIMGPSGSGKTTLLDVLLGRRTAGYTEGEIFINGLPLHKMRDWFIMNTGYVRQLAKSYYNELTVRENLVFSMSMQAEKGMTLKQKLERVEQVIRETGLEEQADVKVGDGIGLGLSGGQRKRLDIAVQLLSMPNIIFLDEPTSGLDSASSLDILKSLQVMVGTGRAIVVTIHQPRSEIFHAFDKILLLCNGQIAFFGSPVKVWEFFRQALIGEKELKESEGQVQDAVLDLLKEKRSQRQVLRAYKESNEPDYVRQAVLDNKTDEVDHPHMTQRYSHNPGLWQRLMALESRASLRQTLFTIIYLPIVYTVFGLVIGSTYLFTREPVQILSATCLLSCSSSLFMSSIIGSLLVEPLKLFYLEHSDGMAKSHELILQVFIRMTAVCTLPLSVCSTLVFGLVYQNYTFITYLVLLLAFLLVNQVWISIFIVLNVLSPSQAHRLCPVFAAIGGFCCGFIVPYPLMPEYYRWIFYINPSFYAYGATSVTVLIGTNLPCNRSSPLECFRRSEIAILERFGLSDINPIQNLVVLISMVIILVIIGILVLQLKVNFGLIKEKLFNAFCVTSKRQRRRVSSANILENPVVLRKSSTRQAMNDTDGKIEDDKKESLKKLHQQRPSATFVESGFHYVMRDFPWKMEALLSDLDETDGEVPQGSSSVPYSPLSRRSRIVSDGSEDVFEPNPMPSITEVMIDMEEDINEEQRRIQANLKWQLRRQGMEREFMRLRHLSINRSRAAGGGARLRHSVSFGDDLEMKLEGSGRHDEENKRETNETEQSFSLGQRSMTLGSKPRKKPFIRSMSMPGKDMDERIHLTRPPKLDTHKESIEVLEERLEEEEDEEEEEVMLGLPPKDIPNVSMEHLSCWSDETNKDEVD